MPVNELENFAQSLGAQVLENEPMSRHTTFKIGGPADFFITVQNERTALKIIGFCCANSIPYMVVGNGSNLLISDKGVRGAVVKYAGNKILVDGEKIVCSAGVSLAALCEAAKEAGLTGLEFAYGIPGSVGGAVYMNAGAYGGEMKDVVRATHHIDGEKLGGFCAGELDFGYRKSAYTGKKLVITKAEFSLKKGDKASVSARMSELLGRRRTKQPLEWPSAGSVFKRPEGHYAGALIEQCGLKGARVGGAMVSEKHAGFIINAGGATCCDVVGLVHKIQSEVQNKTGVSLECEIKIAGEI